MSLILAPDEIEVLTNRRRYKAQAAQLKALRIPYKVRADGFPIVSRVQFEQAMGATPPRRDSEPNWAALNVPTRKTA